MNELKNFLFFKMNRINFLSINYKQNNYFEKLIYCDFDSNKFNITHYKNKDFYLVKLYDKDNNLISKNTFKNFDDLMYI